jgi:hypothetical protein
MELGTWNFSIGPFDRNLMLAGTKSAQMSFGFNRGVGMPRAAKYKRRAADCLRLAETELFRNDRILLVEMAAMWLRLAERAGADEQELKYLIRADQSARGTPVILTYCSQLAPHNSFEKRTVRPFFLAIEMAVARAYE